MLKISFKIFAIILGNLLAFLVLGHILDAFFKTEVQWKIIMLILSILPLCWLLIKVMKQFRKELEILYKSENK